MKNLKIDKKKENKLEKNGNIFRSGTRRVYPLFSILFVMAGVWIALLFAWPVHLPAQEKKENEAKKNPRPERIPVQTIIARLDYVLKLPRGLMTGRMSIVTKTGRTAVWDFSLYNKEILRDEIEQTALLYMFISKRRGLENKLLFLDNGGEIWLWDALRGRLYRKRDFERFQTVLRTGFSYQDISGSTFQTTYNGRRAKRWVTKDKKTFVKLTLVPISPGVYTKLTLVSEKDSKTGQYWPIRIDYHGRNKILFKTMNLYYDGAILDRTTGKRGKKRNPTRLEVLDLSTGVISRIEFFTLDPRVNPEDAFFDPDFLNR